MNEPPGARARVGLTGLTVAEHFRDAEGQDVLLFIDNIFRFTQVSAVFVINVWECPYSAGLELIISVINCRLTLRCLHCSVVFHLLWVTSQLWLLILEAFKSVLQPPRKVPSPLSRLSMCLLMI